MAFKINESNTTSSTVTADEKLWLTEDGTLVADGDPAARSLFAAAGDEIPRADALRLGLVKPTKADKAEQAEEGAELVEAKVDDVLAEVGDDPEKARLALEAEQASEKPRKSLVEKLEKIAAG